MSDGCGTLPRATAMARSPEQIFARLSFAGLRASELCEAALSALTPPWPAVTRWSAPLGGEPGSGPLLAALADPAIAKQETLLWFLGPKLRFTAMELEDGAELSLRIRDTAPGRCKRWLAAVEALLARLLEAGTAASGTVQWWGPGMVCLPELPVVERRTWMVVTDEPALRSGFGDAERALAAGAWETRRVRGHLLLKRAMHAETNVAMLDAIHDGHWAMARLAQPGLTRYRLPTVEPEEAPIFFRGEHRVRAAGYHPEDRIVVYACHLEPDEHVRGWEVYSLRRIVADKQLPTGEPVDDVQVVFPTRAVAEREKRPLLDAGVFVVYHDEYGRMAQLDEPIAP